MACNPLPAQKWRFITYNCLSLKQAGRQHDICNAFKSATAFGIQGTRLPCSGDAVTFSVQDGFTLFNWGFGKGHATNKCAGVQIGIRTRDFRKKHVVRIWSAPTQLQGRGGAVRVRNGSVDFCFICMYVRPDPDNAQARQGVHQIYEWAGRVMAELPRRCVPVILTDANGRTGMVRYGGNAGEVCNVESSAVGGETPEMENFNGACIRQFCEDQYLCLANTFWKCGHTYWGMSPTARSRIDYIALPVSLLRNISNCSVWHRTGAKLQIISANTPRDHRPVVVDVEHRLQYTSEHSSTRALDRDAIMAAVVYGDRREEFLERVESRCKQQKQQWDEVTGRVFPDAAWQLLSSTVSECAHEVFALSHARYSRPDDTRQAIRDRRDARLALQDVRTQPRKIIPPPSLHSRSWRVYLSQCLQLWRAVAKLERVSKSCHLLCRRDNKRYQQQVVHELQEAWRRRDLATVWKLGRKLGGRSAGPKKRKYNVPNSTRPSSEQWATHLKQTGPLGGCSADVVDWDGLLYDRLHCATDTRVVSNFMQMDALSDLRELRWQLRDCKTRRSVPEWSVPAEVWRMLTWPNLYNSHRRRGLGFETPNLALPVFQECMRDLMCVIRRTKQVPQIWHLGLGYEISKHNNKPGCAGIRLVWSLDPVGKLYYKALWNRGNCTAERVYASGYLGGRRREQAIATQQLLRWRLRHTQRGHCTVLHDVANAFPSPCHAALQKACSEVGRDLFDRQLLRQRHEDAVLCIRAHDATIHMRPKSGNLQGDSIASIEFLQVYHPSIDAYVQARGEAAQPLCVSNPLDGCIVDPSLTTFADDLAETFLVNSAADLQRLEGEMDAALSSALSQCGISSNESKKVFLPKFCGKGSGKEMRRLFHDHVHVQAQVQRVSRYLGNMLHISGSNAETVDARLQAMQRNWYMLQRFWHNPGVPRRVRILVFTCMVYSTALSGLSALVLARSECKVLNVRILLYGRKLMQGRACAKTCHGDDTTYKSISNLFVWRWLGLVPVETALRIQRLRWLQHIVRVPSSSTQLLALLFGKMECETTPQLLDDGCLHSSASPWLVQLVSDVDALDAIDDTAHIPARMQGKPIRLFTDTELRHDFLLLDVGILASSYLSVSIPPPAFQAALAASPQACPTDDTHRCDFVSDDGVSCGACFPNARALATHRWSAHGITVQVRRLVVTNQCPWCMAIFSSTAGARTHAQNSFKSGLCRGIGSNTAVLVREPPSLVCPECLQLFPSLVALQWHIASHLPGPDILL